MHHRAQYLRATIHHIGCDIVSGNRWGDVEREIALSCNRYADYHDACTVAKIEPRTHNAWAGIRKTVRADDTEPTDNPRQTDDVIALARAQMEIRQLRARQTESERETVWARTVLDGVREALPTIATPVLRAPPVHDSESEDEEYILVLSDVHAGLKVNEAEMGGINAYSQEIMLRRAERLVDAVLSIREKYHVPAKRLNVFQLGDILEGNEIFRGQHFELESHVAEQIVVGGRLLADIYTRLSGAFEEVVVTALEGNHGRITFGKSSAPVGMSFDWLLTKFAEEMLRDNDRIRMVAAESWWRIVERCNHRFMLAHGDGIKGGFAGLPWYGMVRRMTGNIGMLQPALPDEVRGTPFHTMIIGHFHTPANLEWSGHELFVNGSWPGGTKYSAKEMSGNSLPAQWLLCVHPKRGITARWLLRLEDREHRYDDLD